MEGTVRGMGGMLGAWKEARGWRAACPVCCLQRRGVSRPSAHLKAFRDLPESQSKGKQRPTAQLFVCKSGIGLACPTVLMC